VSLKTFLDAASIEYLHEELDHLITKVDRCNFQSFIEIIYEEYRELKKLDKTESTLAYLEECRDKG